MTGRERIMIYLLGGLLVAGLGFVALTMLVRPIREQNERIDDLTTQVEDRTRLLDFDRRNNRRLLELAPLSLPANRELAEGEYETLLGRLLRDSQITGGKYVKQTQSDSDPEPELTPGTPGKPGKKAYAKVIYSITLEKITLAKLTAFLDRYQRVPLLHQIVKCSIKHAVTNPAAAKGQKAEERNDLTVVLVSEAVLLDGAPDRKTLFDVPDAFGAALGGVALFGLTNDTEKTRYLTPTPNAAYYAVTAAKRDYDLLAARDVFHGPLPEYPPDPVKPKSTGGEKPVEPPPYDPSPFVYLNALVRTADGGRLTAQADVADRYYDQFYSVALSQFNDLLEVKVQRFTKSTKTDAKTREVTGVVIRDPDHPRTGAVMEVSDRASKAIRTFKVYGLNGNALVIGEKEKAAEPAKEDKAKAGGGRPQKGAKPPAALLPKPDPHMAAVGGLGAVHKAPEKVYRWEVGQSLAMLKPLPEKEAKAAIESAVRGLAEPPPPPPAREVEVAPPPRRPLL